MRSGRNTRRRLTITTTSYSRHQTLHPQQSRCASNSTFQQTLLPMSAFVFHLHTKVYFRQIQISADLPAGGYYVAVSRMHEPLVVILQRRGSEFVERCSLPPSPLFREDPWAITHARENPPHVKQFLHWHITYRNVPVPHHAVLLRWHPSRPLLVIVRRTNRLERSKGALMDDGD